VILLCYDGSENAQAAADQAATLFRGSPVTVVTVWEPYLDILAVSGFGLEYAPPLDEGEKVDSELLKQATATAQEGAERLQRAGADARARPARQGTNVAATTLALADELDAQAIVVGTRGRGGVKSLLLGSVSHDIVQHADRPVVVVPSRALAEARRSHSAAGGR
jgi:nucleotide-binding universal stress UspA family protein